MNITSPSPHFLHQHHATLLTLLKAFSYKQGDFTLASGAKSKYLIDCKDTLLTSTGHGLAAYLIINAIAHLNTPVHGVAGVALGGLPLASAVSTLSAQWSGRAPYDALYIRKEPKDHGTEKLIEGQLLHGNKVVLCEDVLTTGGSAIKALRTLCKHGYEPVAVITVVDRLEGGKENIQSAFNLPVVSLYTINDFK